MCSLNLHGLQNPPIIKLFKGNLFFAREFFGKVYFNAIILEGNLCVLFFTVAKLPGDVSSKKKRKSHEGHQSVPSVAAASGESTAMRAMTT